MRNLPLFFLFLLPAVAIDSVVVFNEIHYHPENDNSSLEYVELYNQLAVDVDLSNWRLDGDIRYDFPEGTVLGGGGYLVIARNPAALAAGTGHQGALGPYEGFLANSGNRIRLYNNNRAFSTSVPEPTLDPEKLWSVDIQGDGNEGSFGQRFPPATMSGAVDDLGDHWNVFAVAGHDGTTTDPTLVLSDSTGSPTGVTFSISGTVSGWSQSGSALLSDYLFVGAGNSADVITWEIGGLSPGGTYTFIGYGGVNRDISLTLDRNGDGSLSGESAVLANSGGLEIAGIMAGTDGRIRGSARRGSLSEGNWSGFQLFAEEARTTPVGGVPNPSLEARRVMDEIDFSDNSPWPQGPDGSGFTLAKVEPSEDSGHPDRWRTSLRRHGSPGSPNAFPPAPTLVLNEVSPGGTVDFRIELFNAGDSPVALDDFIVRSSNPDHPDHRFPEATLEPGAFRVLDTTALGFVPADNNRIFLLSADRNQFFDAIRLSKRPRQRFPDGAGPWLVPERSSFGSENLVVLEDAIVINEIFYHAYPVRSEPPTPPGIIAQQVLDFDSVWRYNLNSGANGLPPHWAASPHPADGFTWAEGAGLLGFESTPLAEPIRTNIRREAKISYYFETDFTYTGTEEVVEMLIEHFTDDGAVFYLNGIEIGRFQMDGGEVLATTPASSTVGEASLESLIVANPAILPGLNRLSVEVHQSNPRSSDMVWGSRVTLRLSDGTGTPGVEYDEPDEEWLELYNRGTESVDLGGWSLGGGISYDFSPGTTLAPDDYLVVAREAAALAQKHPGITIAGDFSARLANSGEEVILTDERGNPVDQVSYYDDRKWHAGADGGGSSLELIDPDADNSVAGSWAASDESTRSEWRTHTYEGIAVNDGIGNNVYHEFLLGLLDAGEFLLDDVSVLEEGNLELIQNGDFENDTPGQPAVAWRAVGTHGSHGRTVVVNDPDSPGNQCLHVVATGPTGDKHNKLETTFASGERVTPGRRYRITFRAKWLGGSNQVNTRLYFNYLQKTQLLEVPEIWGTPGAVNSSTLANAGPALDQLAHQPVVPDSGEATTVTIAAHDGDGIEALALFYAVNDGSFQNVPMSASRDGFFSGTIPGQSRGDIVRFYVEAVDQASAVSRFPADGPDGGAFFQVQDGFADQSGIRHNLRIIMSHADRSFLFRNTNRMSNDRFPVTVIANEETVYYDVGLRLKASAFGRYNSGHYGFNIRFQPDQLFRGVHRTVSVERSPNLKEILAKHLMNRAGGGYGSFYDDVAHIITPLSGDRGVGLLSMSRHTSSFFEGLFPDAADSGTLFNQELLYNPNGTTGGPEGLKIGNPYNHTNGRYDLEDRGTDKEPYRWGFQIRSARGRDDYSQLIALNQTMERNGPELKAALDELIDVDQWMRTFAMISLNGTDDIYSRIWEHNFRYFVRPTDGKIIVLQWDLDRAFNLGTTSSVPPTRNTVRKLFAIPEYRRRFDGHLLDLARTSFNSDYLTTWASHFSSLTGDNLNSLPGYVTARANHALSTLPDEIPFAITSNDGDDFDVSDSAVTLAGRGWINVHEITVNDLPAPLTWSGSGTWETIIPVALGPNPLELKAFNYQGLEVGRDEITVTNTSAIDLARADNIIIRELHYHPADPSPTEVAAGFGDADAFEFIEILNTSDSTEVDLSGCRLNDGVDFTFPTGLTLLPGERLLIVANREAFHFRYGHEAGLVAGEYLGQLRNSGERVRLEAADGTVIADFTYHDVNPWPPSADGSGYSLVFSGLDPADPLSWRSSVDRGGTPGSDDGQAFGGDENTLLPYALASGPQVANTTGTFLISFEENLASDDALVVVEASADLENWLPLGTAHLVARQNQGDGTARITYAGPDPIAGRPGQFLRVRVILKEGAESP